MVEVGRNLQVKTAVVKEARKQYLMATPTEFEAISKPCTAAAADAVREEARFSDRVPKPVMTRVVLRIRGQDGYSRRGRQRALT